MAAGRYAIIADDFTGAGDSGVHFARAGLRTGLLFRPEALPAFLDNHDAVSISTESRFLPAAAAASLVAEVIGRCKASGVSSFFKKVDSTLRGNIGAEIAAALTAGGYTAALVCTAMPKTGRVIRDGVLYVNGTPIAETALGSDPFNPVPSSLPGEILAAQSDLPVGHIGLDAVRGGGEALAGAVRERIADGCRLLVADAASDDDLAALGAFLRQAGDVLPAGAGGLAEAIAGPAAHFSGDGPTGRLLAVIGSLNPTSLAQIDAASASGAFHVLSLDMERAQRDLAGEIERLQAQAAASDRHLLVKNRVLPAAEASGSEEQAKDAGLRAAEVFGQAALALSRAAGCRTLYVTGGSTAVAVADALGLGGIRLERELMPGVVLGCCRSERAPVRWFISKAGGFGDDATLVRLAGMLA